MELSAHPFQRLGAHAAAVLIGRGHPRELTDTDLNTVVERIINDAEMASTAVKGGRGWAWQQRLAGMFPQCPPTHPNRAKFTQSVAQLVRGQFAPDAPDANLRCWTCGRPASLRWGKALWPLTESSRYLNTSNGGQPVCRECRIAVWCLPYSAGYDRGQAITIDTFNEALERAVVAAHVHVAQQVTGQEWADWSAAPDSLDLITAALHDHPAQLELQRWNSGNREQSLQQYMLTESAARWLTTAQRHGYGAYLEVLGTQTAYRWHPLRLAASDKEAIMTRVAHLLERYPLEQKISAIPAHLTALVDAYVLGRTDETTLPPLTTPPTVSDVLPSTTSKPTTKRHPFRTNATA